VGADHPACDTFVMGSMHGGAMGMTGSVGACKVDHCRHNTSFLCSAPSIEVAFMRNMLTVRLTWLNKNQEGRFYAAFFIQIESIRD